MHQVSRPYPNRVIRRKAVLQIIGIGNSSFYELLDPKNPRYDPTFPRPFALSARSRGWIEAEVVAWVEAKAAKRL